MPIYKLRNSKVEAIQYTGQNADECEEVIGVKFDKYIDAEFKTNDIVLGIRNNQMSILIRPGDYIIKSGCAGFMISSQDSFEQTYKLAKNSNNDLSFN